MKLLVAAAILLLAGVALALFVIILLRKQVRYIDTKDTLLGRDELKKHAAEMAQNQIVGKRKQSYKWLMPRMRENYQAISDVYQAFNRDVENAFPTAPVAEWLLDNFYIIQEQVADLEVSLSKGFPSGLRVINSGIYQGYPRIYSVAVEIVSHTDGAVDEDVLKDFVKEYQSQSLLSMSELWTLAVMVRVALIENIRQICDRATESQKDWHRAEEAADFFSKDNEERLADIARERLTGPLTPSFVEHLLREFRKNGINMSKAIGFLDKKLGEENLTSEKITEIEHHIQASRQVSMGNSITSLRFLSSMNWSDIFEELSHVEQLLWQDPAGVYPKMDFDSRNHYRSIVQSLARKYNISEVQIVKNALECAQDTEEEELPLSHKHVGYYIKGNGTRKLEEKCGYRGSGTSFFAELIKASPAAFYVGTIVCLTLLIAAIFIYYGLGAQEQIQSIVIFALALAVLIPCSDIAVSIVNSIISHIVKPSILPKMELKDGIPQEATTMVIVPTLLPNEKRARELVAQLEITYLSNKEENLYFALVGDFKDSPEEKQPDDDKILLAALQDIKKLNQKYSVNGVDIFYYFHRYRQYNDRQNKWMGWERKRGAIAEFNRLLKGSTDTSYNVISGDVFAIPEIKYVITLDADTNLPIGAARKLVGTIMHPLNRAVLNKEKDIVDEGYGLLQPRIGVSITSSNNTLFSRIFAGQGGIDPYTTAVSDIYQDVFGEGIFTGKGIYELDIFEKVLGEAIPDNMVLSHDLLEGSYVRTGLVTDIEMVDGYPARYNAASMRLHRWVRGDWQLLPWLGSSIKNNQGKRIPNPLSAVSKWKIVDNLRRSLINPSLIILLLLAVSVLPGNANVWLALVLITSALPVETHILNVLLSGNYRVYREKRYATSINGFKGAFYQAVLLLIFMPYQAYLMLDAILKTIVKVLFTRRNMLEWVTAADMEANLKSDLNSFWKRMWIVPAAGVVLAVLSLFMKSEALPVILILLIGWICSPYIAYYISKPYGIETQALSDDDMTRLRILARKTWAFYEDFAGEEDNYLPPDNYQEEPTRVIAHRTSPTNIGFLLLGYISARDMGYISTSQMLDTINKTITTIEKMEKWNGHLYNWYETISLRVLRPRYISTVDSGNFVGYLMILEQALKEYSSREILDISLACGLKDLIMLANIEGEGTGESINTASIEAVIASRHLDIEAWRQLLQSLVSDTDNIISEKETEEFYWRRKLKEQLKALNEEAQSELHSKNSFKDIYEDLINRIHKLAENMEFKHLYDEKRELFSIGYNIEEGHLGKSYYDLLASESRQTSYIAVARGEVSPKHWFRLGRKLVMIEGYKGLVSWTGTMFEYLMPLLVMKNYQNTLLDETYSFVVSNQIKYGQNRSIPWGVSESGYSAFDISLNYQYKAFGIPELGLKRGLGNDVVVAPYAAVLALPIAPQASVDNIKILESQGLEGLYGLYEAVDYTPARLKQDEKYSIVKSFMAHHQGMSFVALDNFFNNNIMQARFHSDPVIKSAELMLQEKVPARVTFTKEHKLGVLKKKEGNWEEENTFRTFGLPKSPMPNVHVLSNGSYSVMVTDGGLGYSRNNDLAVSRWNRDIREKKNGLFVFVQNLNSNDVWSTTYEPIGTHPDRYRVIFSPDKAEFIRRDGNIETHTEITVSSEENAEIRRISLTNASQNVREVEVTSYFEVVLTHPDADLAHPAFSNLFIRTEFIRETDSLIASRRPRLEGQKTLWAVHTVVVEGETTSGTEYETDRFKFIGRNRSITNPAALDVNNPLSNSEGAVLDPVMSLRRRVRIEPGKTVRVCYTTGVAESRSKVLELADKYHNIKSVNRAFELAWTRSQVEARYLGLSSEDTEDYLNIIPSILFPSEARKGQKNYIQKNRRGQSGLWSFGVSGDLPVILLKIASKDDMADVVWMLKAHEFWRVKGLIVDLVIMLEDESSYTQPLFDAVRDIISSSHARDLINQRGGVFIVNARQMAQEDVILFHTVASFALTAGSEPVLQQLAKLHESISLPEYINCSIESSNTTPGKKTYTVSQSDAAAPVMQYFNGIGGFDGTGSEYIITLKDGQVTPAPWINVISNRRFGFHVSESGAGYTWAQNGRENKLTPWSNDPVSDPHGEVFYIRDEDRGNFWSMTPMPIRERQPYIIKHGHGYSIFEHNSNGLEQQLTMFAAVEDPVKICIIKLKNKAKKPRKFTVTYYMRPVLGVNDQQTSPYIVTQPMKEADAITITNTYSTDFYGRAAFVSTTEKQYTYTGDRLEFIGEMGSIKDPEALRRKNLSGRLGAGYDPCVAIQIPIGLKEDEEKEFAVLLGQGENTEEAAKLVIKYKDMAAAIAEKERAVQFWKDMLGTIQVKTPDASMDILINGWLLYQVISCRLWARSAFYQSGGAYGFRDQLQDVMAVIYSWPEATRRQILIHSAHQFVEGDVQHWWHAEAGKGIRTKYSDDLLWLPYVTADYIENTGDTSVLDEQIGYLESKPLDMHEDERYEVPSESKQVSSVYQHCIRAIERGLKFGEHGIPLMGCGDWNDGMNTVGNKGKGESVWLGWFLYTVLKKFIPVCRYMKDEEKALSFEEAARKIAEAIEENAWDGSWYRRAYFDDGTPLGSSRNSECRIDSISQSWSMISGVGRPARVKEALNAVEKYLVDEEEGIIKLLTPPFDTGDLHPGYIKGYVPGVRENGGQYTHAATWVIMAFASMGNGDRAWELFNMINPINHSRTTIEYNRYKVEPYVMSADVYAVHPHAGRGGWSWYTGAAGWMYRVGTEHILGIKKRGDVLVFDPCIPKGWKEFKVTYTAGKTVFEIDVKNPEGVSRGVTKVIVDGKETPDGKLPIVQDGGKHKVEVLMGE